MSKHPKRPFWEHETPETIDVGNRQVRYYPKAARLNIATRTCSPTGHWTITGGVVLDLRPLRRNPDAVRVFADVLAQLRGEKMLDTQERDRDVTAVEDYPPDTGER